MRASRGGGRGGRAGSDGDRANRPLTPIAWEGAAKGELSAGDVRGTFDLAVPEAGLAGGDAIVVRLGEGKGIAASTRAPKKFFLLYLPAEGAPPPTTPAGAHQILAACTMHALGGSVHHLRAYAPSQPRPGEPLAVLVRPDDEFSNLSHEPPGDVRVLADGQELPGRAEQVDRSTCVRVHVRLPAEGV